MADRFAHGESIGTERPTLGPSRAESAERRPCARARNKKAVNPLKTNNLAKSVSSRPNDFNTLRPPARNLSFRNAKQFLSFSLIWAFVDASAGQRRGRSGNARPGFARRPRPAPPGTPRCKKVAQGKKWRKGGGKFLKSLARVTLCAARLVAGAAFRRRSRAASKAQIAPQGYLPSPGSSAASAGSAPCEPPWPGRTIRSSRSGAGAGDQGRF